MDTCTPIAESYVADVMDRVESIRRHIGATTDEAHKTKLGQFFTAEPVARLMASMLYDLGPSVRILDPGAGVGVLSAAAVAELCHRPTPPASIHVTAFEIDSRLSSPLHQSLELCGQECSRHGVEFGFQVRLEDFLVAASDELADSLFQSPAAMQFGVVVMNPPYFKIGTGSMHQRALARIGVQAGNAYAGFVAAAMRMLADDGQLVAITPRSFCNGPYFKPFRKQLLREMRLRRVHVFQSRSELFSTDSVLQENVIISAVRTESSPGTVEISSSTDAALDDLSLRAVSYSQVVRPEDAEAFVRVLHDELAESVDRAMSCLPARLHEVGVEVSTGRVVDFRAKEFLRNSPGEDTAPLIYPLHFRDGYVVWPRLGGRKPNAIVANSHTDALLIPNGNYVLTKRFSAKEEKRRVVAAVHTDGSTGAEFIGIENHLNYFHQAGQGLPLDLARGLAAYFNSTLVDVYFRQFSGHTQVNATDLRNLPYPSRQALQKMGQQIGDEQPSQARIDELLAAILHDCGDRDSKKVIQLMARVDEAMQILRELGFPRAQLNERSALTLLALAALKPDASWSSASQPLMGITPLMEFFAEHYGKRYAPNTRETVRRQTVHQFLDAGLVVANPDAPDRPVNSGKNVYQITNEALALIRSYGSRKWKARLKSYLSSIESLQARYAKERRMKRVPIVISPKEKIALSPGPHNLLIRKVLEEFAERFTPGRRVLYVGDTEEKFAYFDEPGLKDLGVVIDMHGKMPDAIIHFVDKNWLILVEAVTSHGPVNPKRHAELASLFAGSTAGLVFVTAFLDRKALTTYLEDISWETEVWVAESPSHLIHFNGQRFLGPHDADK